MIELYIKLLDENELQHLTGIFMQAAIEGRKRIKELEVETESLRRQIESGKTLVKHWEEQNKSLHDELDKPKADKPVSTLESAKNTMKLAGYVFYKYQKPTALQKRRHRRTKKEIEEATARANEKQ